MFIKIFTLLMLVVPYVFGMEVDRYISTTLLTDIIQIVHQFKKHTIDIDVKNKGTWKFSLKLLKDPPYGRVLARMRLGRIPAKDIKFYSREVNGYSHNFACNSYDDFFNSIKNDDKAFPVYNDYFEQDAISDDGFDIHYVNETLEDVILYNITETYRVLNVSIHGSSCLSYESGRRAPFERSIPEFDSYKNKDQ